MCVYLKIVSKYYTRPDVVPVWFTLLSCPHRDFVLWVPRSKRSTFTPLSREIFPSKGMPWTSTV